MADKLMLVCWVEENPTKFSVVPRKDIVDGQLRLCQDAKLIGTVLEVRWERRIYRAKVICFGSKPELQKRLLEESVIADATTALPPTVGASANVVRLSKRARLEAVLADCSSARRNLKYDFDLNSSIQNLKDELQREKEAHTELKEKYAGVLEEMEELKAWLQKSTLESSALLDIGNEVYVTKDSIATLRTVSSGMNTFARNLFRKVFTLDEIVGRSLTGKKCNANIGSQVQPSVDPRKRDAVIQFSLLKYGRHPGTDMYRLSVKDVKHSLTNLVQEINKDARRAEEQLSLNE